MIDIESKAAYKTLDIKNPEIRCINIIDNIQNKHYGQPCNRMIAKRNSKGQIAGNFNCRHCKTKYEVFIKSISFGRSLPLSKVI